MWDGQHEAHFARRRPIGDNCFAATQMAAAGVLSRRHVRWSEWAVDGLRWSFRSGSRQFLPRPQMAQDNLPSIAFSDTLRLVVRVFLSSYEVQG